jgi:hypothetical protein
MEVAYLDLVEVGYMGRMQWLLGREMGTIPAFPSRTQENQEKPVSGWPVAGPSGFWLLASRPASKSSSPFVKQYKNDTVQTQIHSTANELNKQVLTRIFMICTLYD